VTTQPTLADHLWAQQDGIKGLIRQIAFIAAGTAVIAISARVQVPMWPVPMTMQTLAVLLIAVSFGARLAAATLAAYLAQGAVGLPVFAAGGGIAFLVSPTAGYLFGFLVAAVIVGGLADRGWHRTMRGTLATMGLGTAIIYMLGVGWLAVHVGLMQAVSLGLVPFIAGDLVKIAIAVLILPKVWSLVAKIR
jgi:biotin transport system substrate-specific component